MLLYDLGILLYRQGIRIASHTSNVKVRALNAGLDNTFSILAEKRDPADRYIWIHAASLGEFEQGRPLIEMVRRRRPELKIALTFFSPSGYEVRKGYAGADIICYLPIDTPRNVGRFLDALRPEMAIFVKYEFWLNYLKQLRRREIPTYLISGIFRPTQLFFRPWGGFYRKALRAFSHLYVQDKGSVDLLAGIGIDRATAAGDTRFDRVTDIMRGAHADELLTRFCGRLPGRDRDARPESAPIFIAGSSWPEDEKVYFPWLLSGNEAKWVIAPHEFDSRRLDAMLSRLDGRGVLLSEARRDPSLLEGKSVLIIDCFGLLASAYAYADVAYVGGGFGAGLHNINEAAVYGIPVVFGPNNAKFIEAREMKECGGGVEVADAEGFRAIADSLLDATERRRRGDAAGAYILSRLGATERIFADLFGDTATSAESRSDKARGESKKI